MFNLYTKDGKKTVAINIFIDPQWGFSSPDVAPSKGGSLYVPGGEEVPAKMGEIIANTRNGIFVIGQDYHPANHISFMANHPGIMAYRIAKFKDFLSSHGQAVPDEHSLFEVAQQPVHFFHGFDQPPAAFPFEELVLDKHGNIIGIKETDGRIRQVEVKTESGAQPGPHDRGRVSKVLDTYFDKTFDAYRATGTMLHTQTLWTRHCEQGKDSSLYPESMNLPKGLHDKLSGDLKSDVISYTDESTGNKFYVVRKGTNSEIDSYGIGVENDGRTLTPAWNLFAKISEALEEQQVERVDFNIGGLATNFCTEFSVNNVADFLAGHFKMKGMDTSINYMPEISRAIPIPGDADVPFSADGAYERMRRSRGIGQTTIAELLAVQQPGASISGTLNMESAQKEQGI